ncbi:MAG TPA: aminotransferase class V-fold PLP-dependent enzyme [Verrucomicrobiae bacterium]|nr:aminotransferase class V-fold PLP-dependent enzyme [Verrucomicrobiae bacterium]
MTVSELHENEELRHREFPVTRDKIFLAHAGDCPLPRRVVEAIAAYASAAATGDQEKFAYPAVLEKGRALASQLLECEQDEVAFVGPTSLALSLLASGLRFRKGENILIYFDDYPSNVYPWMALAEQGVQVRMMNTRSLGGIRPMDVIGQVDENTRLVALASCHFISGYRIDFQSIGKQLHERGILFCLDGIQTLGAFSTTTENLDMLAADAHKWLLGPCGAGLMYVRKAVQDRVNPPLYGWNNVRCPNYVAQEEITLRTGSQKYEVGTYNLLGIVGLVAGMELLLELGIEEVSRALLRHRALLVPEIENKGYQVLHADAPESARSGIVSFCKPGADMTTLHEKLTAANIVTSLRGARSGQKYIRLSPHFYNTEEELRRALELM